MHALKEASRILIHNGIMIDVRPLSIDVPLEILNPIGADSAGMIDLSPERELDLVADKAINEVLSQQQYCQVKKENFDFTYYWNTVDEMKADLEEYWQDEVIISEETWENARRLLVNEPPGARLRVRILMQLGVYETIS